MEATCYPRYYDPKIARFLTEDTYYGSIADPLSLNLYTYCHNEPVMYTDPSGHWEVGDKKKSAAAQAQILKATKEYSAAAAKGDKIGMATAHKKAEDARAGKIYNDKSVSKQDLEKQIEEVSKSKYVSKGAKSDLGKSTVSYVTQKSSNNEERDYKNSVVDTINKTRKNSNLVEPRSVGTIGLWNTPKTVSAPKGTGNASDSAPVTQIKRNGEPFKITPLPDSAKQTEPFTIEGVWNKAKSVVVVEVGAGLGIGIEGKLGPTEAGAGVYSLDNYTLEDGVITHNKKQVGEAHITLVDNLEVGSDYETKINYKDNNNTDNAIFANPNWKDTWNYGLSADNKNIYGSQSKGQSEGYRLTIGGKLGFGFAVEGEIGIDLKAAKDFLNYFNVR